MAAGWRDDLPAMKPSLRFLFLLLAFASVARGADHLVITVAHDLAIARPSETITVPWTEVQRALPGALLQCLAVKDVTGRSLPYQVTNLSPLVRDPQGVGISYGDLIFQHNFAAGEKSATFTVEMTATVAPV